MDNNTVYRIYKYPLPLRDLQLDSTMYVDMPFDAKPISVDNQDGEVTLWAKVPIKVQGATPHGLVRIGIFGTGHDLPTNIHESRFIGTVLTEGGQLVWHVWLMS